MANKEENKELNHMTRTGPPTNESDAAGKSLSEALEISFAILKVIMIILVIAFLASGFKTVGTEEEALVLRFGKIREMSNGKRVLTSGLHWILPYPIDEIVKIPVARKDNLDINTFWYYLTQKEILAGKPDELSDPNKALDPLRDGYCLTRSEASIESGSAGDDDQGNDYNIVHTQWQLTYHIKNPEMFFTNVKIPDVKPDDIYDDVIKRGVEPLLQSMFEGVVVFNMVNYTVDEAITSRDRIPARVMESLQKKLDDIDSGIEIVSVQLTKSEVPRQVRQAFEATTKASQIESQAITQAKSNETKLLNETAGPVAMDLFNALHDDTVSKERKEYLWLQLSGKTQENLAEARIYAAKVVKNAQASAQYLQSLLPEYRKRPDIVINRLYYDMMEKILSNAEEKFTIQSSPNAKGSQLWINLNKDTSLKPLNNQEEQKK
jgi:membrane protease subunit HflK